MLVSLSVYRPRPFFASRARKTQKKRQRRGVCPSAVSLDAMIFLDGGRGGVLVAHQQAAQLGVEAAQRAAFYDLHLRVGRPAGGLRSEEHTSELQSRFDIVCR